MPLTTAGIAIQILSSLKARGSCPDDCTVNDCKFTVNHLIRKFSEVLGKTGVPTILCSRAVASGSAGNTVLDHAVPVIVLIEQLLTWPMSDLEISPENIERVVYFLKVSLVLVEVIRDEDRALSKSGLQREMPDGWRVRENVLYGDPLARYKACKLKIEA